MLLCILPSETTFSNDYIELVRKNIEPTQVSYNVNIDEKYALCKLEQTYELNLSTDIESCEYRIPIDYNSAICSLKITTPRETINPVVKEKKKS